MPLNIEKFKLFLTKQQEGSESLLKKQQEILKMLQEKHLHVARFSPIRSHKYNLCGKREHRRAMCLRKSESRMLNVIKKVKQTVSQMAEPIASSKKGMKWNENPQRNPQRTCNKIQQKEEQEKEAEFCQNKYTEIRIESELC
ncbi:hypothetical protein ACTXT7_013394 [Hymenolepis weldensis]